MDFVERKLVARMPSANLANGCQWLVIDYDQDLTRGFYLFICGKDPEDVLVDHWFKTEAEARAFAREKLNVADTDWEATKRCLDKIKELHA